jgi:hypothetical protein
MYIVNFVECLPNIGNSEFKHASLNNWNYTEYIPVVPHYLTNNYE